ncbi:MAG: YncE family protein [Candidatus Thermoplasmatota archaeon]|nr:YncE family protein [Candidatus Thermoplasmatota archaeon]
MVGIRKWVWTGKGDRGIAEIIGTLLVFSMVVVFTTGFVLYYVPTSGANNERVYMSEALSSINEMASKLDNFNGNPGSGITQEIPMGITGSFFSKDYNTEAVLSGNSGNYHLQYSLSLGIQLEGYNPGNHKGYNRVVGNINTGASGTDGIAFDSQNGYLYVINYYSSNVSIIDGSTNQVVGTINNLQGNPVGITYDSGDNRVFVSLQNSVSNSSGWIAVINPSTNQLQNYIKTPYFLYGITYDPESGRIFASFTSYYLNEYYPYNTISGLIVYNASSESYYGTIAQPAYNFSTGEITIPSSVSYDPSNGLIYVAGAVHIWAIDGVTDVLVKKIPISSPWVVAFDSFNGNIYATAAETTNQAGLSPAGGSSYQYIYVINGTTNQIVSSDTLTVGEYPTTMIYDPANRYVYAANYQTDTIIVINGVTNQIIDNITVGNGPGPGFNSLAYDSANGEIYVSNLNSNNITAIEGNTVLNGKGWKLKNSELPLSDALYGNGSFFILANTQFVPSTMYMLEDGTPLAISNGQGLNTGGLPFVFNSSVSGFGGLSVSIQSLRAEGVSYSTDQNLMAQVLLLSHDVMSLGYGDIVEMQNTTTHESLQVQILNVYLDSFNYWINSTYASVWDYSYYIATHPYTTLSFYQVTSMSSWSFDNGHISVDYSPGVLSFHNTVPIILFSINIDKYTYSATLTT